MEKMMRTKFLTEFLGALGTDIIEYSEITPERVRGRVIYDPGDGDESQEFVWQVTEADVPSKEATLLAKFIKEQSFLSIDQITVTRSELKERFQDYLGMEYSPAEFELVLEELLSIEVPMVDGDEVTDVYFIHE
jgi:hypothetical protein